MTMRIGIVGWGGIAREHAYHLKSAGATLAGIVSRRRDLDLEVPVFSSLQEMLPSVDALTIAVPNHLHASLCLQGIKARKPVLVEKPLCITQEDLDQLASIMPKMKVPVHLGYRLRWNPSIQSLKKRLQGIRQVRCIYRIGIEHLAHGKDWIRDAAFSGGALLNIGVHALDLARWLAGARGEPLTEWQASADVMSRSANFPLCASISGALRSGVRITAGADLRGSSDSGIELMVDAERGGYPDGERPPPRPEDERAEYAGLIGNFIGAAEREEWDPIETAEILQTHRELLLGSSIPR
jgi:predicted dehydrogenase